MPVFAPASSPTCLHVLSTPLPQPIWCCYGHPHPPRINFSQCYSSPLPTASARKRPCILQNSPHHTRHTLQLHFDFPTSSSVLFSLLSAPSPSLFPHLPPFLSPFACLLPLAYILYNIIIKWAARYQNNENNSFRYYTSRKFLAASKSFLAASKSFLSALKSFLSALKSFLAASKSFLLRPESFLSRPESFLLAAESFLLCPERLSVVWQVHPGITI